MLLGKIGRLSLMMHCRLTGQHSRLLLECRHIGWFMGKRVTFWLNSNIDLIGQ